MNQINKTEQQNQEAQYAFPYHYIPRIHNKRFTQNINFSWGYEYLSYLNFLIKEIQQLTPEMILDVGCGDGRFLHELHQSLAIDNLVGLDYSERAIQFAKVFNPTIQWVVGDIKNPKLLKHTFPLITLIETLEHIPPNETKDFLKGIHFYLKQNGCLLLTVPSLNVPVTPKHFRHFSQETLRETLQDFFIIEKLVFLNRIDVWRFNLLKRFLTNPLFICQSSYLVNFIYQFYQRHCVHATQTNGARIYALCRPITQKP